MESLDQLDDQRRARGKRYSISLLLIAIVLAKLCGQHRPTAIAEWIRLRRESLAKALGHERSTAPSLNTIQRTLASAVSVEKLRTNLNRFLHQQYGRCHIIQVAIDGKTLRGTIPTGHGQGVHLLAAYLPAEGIGLMQIAVETKENELVKAPGMAS